MKPEIVQTACPAATGNYDITGVTPTSDMVGAMFWESAAVTNNLNSGNMRFSFGATDGTNNLSLSMGGANAATTAGIASQLSTTLCIQTATGGGAVTPPSCVFNSFLSNGVRLTANTVTSGRLLETLLLSGTDSQMACNAVQFGTADTSKTITHTFNSAPDVIILLISLGQNGTDTSGTGISVGFWDRASANQSAMSFFGLDNAATTDITGYINNSHAGSIIGDGSFAANVTVASVGPTTFQVNLSSAADATNKMVGWIALKGVGAQMNSGNLVATLPTGTGNTALITGLPGKPQVYIALPTRMTVVNTIAESDAAGSIGASFAATPDFVTTYQGSSAHTFQFGVATSVAHHQISNTRGLLELLNTGAADAIGTLSTWDSGGATINYSSGASGAFLAPVLAFGMPPVNTLAPYPYTRTQFFVNDTVTYS